MVNFYCNLHKRNYFPAPASTTRRSKQSIMGKESSGKSSKSKAGKPESQENSERKGSFTLGRQPKTVGRTPVEAHKFETAPPSRGGSSPASDEDLGELPQTYFEDTIFAVARDPQWLFVYWDVNFYRIPAEETKDSARKIFLKAHGPEGEESCVHVNPEARNWYLPVNQAGGEYWVELGYFDQNDAWQQIVASGKTRTPGSHVQAESASDDVFVTVPVHLTFQHLLDTVKQAMAEGESLISAVSRLQADGRRLAFLPGRAPEWTEDQKRILATLLGSEIIDQLSLGSEEIDQLLRKQLNERLHTESASALSAAGRFSEIFGGSSELFGAVESSLFSGIGASWSGQPFGERSFFMHVNAEVIFYGGTHPDAKVTIGGESIQLQPDGSFRYHFKFPDGNFEIPIVAVSPDGVETRSALLDFRRGTERTGEVGHTGQPDHLADEPMGRR